MKKYNIEVGDKLICKINCRLIGLNAIIILPDKIMAEFTKSKKYNVIELNSAGIYLGSNNHERYLIYNIEIPQIFYISPILSPNIKIL